jgi:rare lipoprotein A
MVRRLQMPQCTGLFCALVLLITSQILNETQAGEHEEIGLASFYFHGEKTASGEPFDSKALTGAHRTVPFGTMVRVTMLKTGKQVTVRINDRGPFVKGRIIDVSRHAAEVLGMVGAGLATVKVEIVR